MPIAELTGTETARFNEVKQRWVNFEPESSGKFLNYGLYSLPLGQTFAAEMILNTGSVTFESGTVNIKKDIHVFEQETEALRFMNEMGTENIASITERYVPGEPIRGRSPDLSVKKIIEIQLVNIPQLNFEVSLLNKEVERGFKVEVFSSGSNGLYEIQQKPKFNAREEIVSDTFLKYFEVQEE